MIADVEKRIVKARNEIKALKVASELAYSSILMPENSPTQSYSGSIDLSAMNNPMARVAVTFTRIDGINTTPFVDFSVDTNIDSFEEWVKSIGGTITGRDVNWGENGLFSVYVDSTTDSSVTCFVDVSQSILQLQGLTPSANFSLDVTAISPVRGTLTVERIL